MVGSRGLDRNRNPIGSSGSQQQSQQGPKMSMKATSLVAEIDTLENDRDDVLERLRALEPPTKDEKQVAERSADSPSSHHGKQNQDTTQEKESKRDYLIRTGKLNPLEKDGQDDQVGSTAEEDKDDKRKDQVETVQNLFQGDYEESDLDSDQAAPEFVDDGDEYHYQKRLQRS